MENRFDFGMSMLQKVDGSAGVEVVTSLGDLGKLVAEVFGDIYGREGLSLREREIATIAMLTVLGREPQLKVHVHAGLHIGLTPKEIEEVIIHTVPYAGFPTAINGVNLLKSMTEPSESQ
jgi:4-carboxymuconolactone decarboxylase